MRVAVIGCGAISKNHIAAIEAAGQTLCALCDVDTQKAQALGLKVPVYADFSELLQAEKPDCVHICTPHYLHASMCVEALGKGVNVLCEKPLAITQEQLDAVLAAEKASSATLGVCLQNRYEPNFAALKELAEAESVASLAGSVFWNRDENYYASGDWRGKWDTEGGGAAINQALHTVDLLQHLGGMPKYVTAHFANDHLPAVEVEDTIAARLETEDGRVFSFFATTGCGHSFPAMVQLRTQSKKTCIATSNLLTVDGETTSQQAQETVGKSVWGRGHKLLIADFYDCLQKGKKFPIDGTEGAKSVCIILKMYESDGKKAEI